MAKDSRTLVNLTIAVLAILSVYWIAIGLLQLVLAASMSENRNLQTVFCLVAAWNILISIVNLTLIRDVRRRAPNTRRNLKLYTGVGIVWAAIALLTGAGVQLLPLLLYAALGILIRLNKDYFTSSAAPQANPTNLSETKLADTSQQSLEAHNEI